MARGVIEDTWDSANADLAATGRQCEPACRRAPGGVLRLLCRLSVLVARPRFGHMRPCSVQCNRMILCATVEPQSERLAEQHSADSLMIRGLIVAQGPKDTGMA